MENCFDVLVAGGGTAGVVAAIQAAAAAACVSLQEGVPVGQLNVESVRKLLSQYDAILP